VDDRTDPVHVEQRAEVTGGADVEVVEVAVREGVADVVETTLQHDAPAVDDVLAQVLHDAELVAGEQHRRPGGGTCASSTDIESVANAWRPEKGSSRTTSSGSCSGTAASWTRCWLPWDRSPNRNATGR